MASQAEVLIQQHGKRCCKACCCIFAWLISPWLFLSPPSSSVERRADRMRHEFKGKIVVPLSDVNDNKADETGEFAVEIIQRRLRDLDNINDGRCNYKSVFVDH